jgi:uncharacterized membrane protein SpoIIM required for sporulation
VTTPSGCVKISFDQLLAGSYWKYSRNLVLVVPTMLQTSLQVMGQTVVLLPALVLVFQLLKTNFLQNLVDAINNRLYDQIPSLLESPQVEGSLVLFIVVVVAGLVVLNIVGGGILAAAEFGTYSAVVEGGEGTVNVGTIFGAMSRLWRGLVKTQLVYSLVVFGPLALSLGVIFVSLAIAVASSFSPGTIFLILAGGILSLAALVAAAILYFLGVYTFPAAVLEGKTGLAAYKRSYHIARENFRLTFSYAVVRVAAALAVTAIGVLASYVGAPLSSLGQALLTLFLIPFMHLSKTTIYYNVTHSISLGYEPTPSISGDVSRGIKVELLPLVRLGLRELVTYVMNVENLIYHGAAVMLFIFGIIVGELISDSGLGDVLRQLGIGQGKSSALAGLSPVPLGIDIFFHNWQVAISVALSGLGFIVPVAVSMMFNGIILGALARVVPSFSYLVAGILPHGVIELPAFFVAGSIGLKLGVYSIRAVAQRRAGEDQGLSSLLRQAVFVAVGLAPLFLIAGLIEAIVTPIVLAHFH